MEFEVKASKCRTSNDRNMVLKLKLKLGESTCSHGRHPYDCD